MMMMFDHPGYAAVGVVLLIMFIIWLIFLAL
jgi:hypothetical protein